MRKKECEHGVIYNGDCLDVMPAVIAIKQKNFLLKIMFFALHPLYAGKTHRIILEI
ncbi:MAG: hypothetical protein GY801_08220 [bacterium]|nr:hypothetical protein [bacterium]